MTIALGIYDRTHLPSLTELLKEYNCLDLSVLKDLGLGIFLYFAVKSLNTLESLEEVYDKGLIVLDGVRLTSKGAKAALADYYIRQEKYRCLFVALETATLCIVITPSFGSYSMSLALDADDRKFTRLFGGLHTTRGKCSFCQIRNMLRFNISRNHSMLPRDIVELYSSDNLSFDSCKTCVIEHCKLFECIDEKLIPFILGWPCVRLNIPPKVIEFLFPNEEPFQDNERASLENEDLMNDINNYSVSGEELWNLFLAEYFSMLFTSLEGKASQKVDVLYSFDNEKKNIYKEQVEVDCAFLSEGNLQLVVENFSGGTLTKHHDAHLLRKFRVFSLLRQANVNLKCVYVHFGKRKKTDDYMSKIASFLASGHEYVVLDDEYSQLEDLCTKRKLFGPAELRPLYESVIRKIGSALNLKVNLQ